MIDQVIVRPDLMDALDFDSLDLLEWPEIVSSIGCPDEDEGSDHFPLCLDLN